MRVTVLRAEGVPDGCILSVKAGDQRRQMPLSSEGQSLWFDSPGEPAAPPLSIDLLDKLASCSTTSLTDGDHDFEVQTNRGEKCRLVLRLEEVGGDAAAAQPQAARPAASDVVTGATPSTSSTARPVNFNSTGSSVGLFGREAKIASDAHLYLEGHQLMQAMRAGLSRVLRERPVAPHSMLAQEILRLRGPIDPEVNGANGGYPVPMPPTAAVGSTATAAEKPVRMMDLFAVPALERDTPLRALDFGSGEVGFYLYGGKGDARCCKQVGDKMKGTFLTDWVEKQKYKEFAEELLRRYEVDDSVKDVVFIAGATGINREALQGEGTQREAVKTFSSEVEAVLRERLGRVCHLRIFVPSGALEAQYELRAVEWLLAESAVGDPELAPHLDAFVGTISAGGGSSQLSVRGGSGAEAVQLFSVPLGNKKPLNEKWVSCPPTQAEIDAWIDRYRAGLKQAAFPYSLHGLFVCISATYYAAKEAKCADRVLSKAEAIDALTVRLTELLTPNPAADAKKTAFSAGNVSMVRALLEWVLHKDAKVIFRRNWKVNGEEAAATWTLGFYAETEAIWRREAECAPVPLGSPTCKGMMKLMNKSIGDRRKAFELARSQHTAEQGQYFQVPVAVSESGPSLLLDLGLSRVGFYTLQVDGLFHTIACKVASESRSPFEEKYLAESRADAFAAEVSTRFSLTAGEHLESVSITSGVTGDYRLRLSADPQERRRLADFITEVEAALKTRLCGRAVRFDVFVPSPDMVVKLELSAAEWFIKMLSGSCGAYDDFVGILSVSTSGARLALRTPESTAPRSKQAYIVELTPDMQAVEIHATLAASGFPRGLRGFFLITAEDCCQCAEAAGIACGTVLARDAAAALAHRVLDPNVDKTDQNLGLSSMLAEILLWTFEGKEASVMFRHAWHVGEVAGCAPLWALGLLTSQTEDEGMLAAIKAQRLSR